MKLPMGVIGLAAIWVLSTGRLTLTEGLIGLVLAWSIRRLVRSPPGARIGPRALLRGARFAVHYAWEFLRSCMQVGAQSLGPVERLRPAVIDVPVSVRSDAEAVLLSNLLSYSPGTLCVEVAADRSHLTVHVMSLEDEEALRRHIRDDLERHVRDLLG